MDNYYSYENLNRNNSRLNLIIHFLLCLYVCIMPLIIFGRFEFVNSPIISNQDALSSGYMIDIFTHYKFFFTLLISATVFVLFFYQYFFKNIGINKSSINILLIVFTISICISTLLSPNISTSLYGFYLRSDGAITWLCYISLFFITSQIHIQEKKVRTLFLYLIPFIFINFVIIMLNYYNHDVLKFEPLVKILTIGIPNLFDLGEGGQLLGTLDQWNYLSGMFAMITLALLSFSLTSTNLKMVITSSIFASLSTLIVLLSISTSGFLTIMCCLPLLIFIIIKNKHYKHSIITICIYLLICTPFYIIWSQETKAVYTESFGSIATIFNSLNTKSVTDSEIVELDTHSILPSLPMGNLGAGSGRLYIWNNTFELIKQRPFLGYGLDTLAYFYPQYKIDKRAHLNTEAILIDKPHNAYLGVFYGTGLIGFLCFLTLAVLVFIKLIKSIIDKNWLITPLAIFAVAYFIQAMFNDSIVATTGLTFLFMGFCFNKSLNSYNKKALA